MRYTILLLVVYLLCTPTIALAEEFVKLKGYTLRLNDQVVEGNKLTAAQGDSLSLETFWEIMEPVWQNPTLYAALTLPNGRKDGYIFEPVSVPLKGQIVSSIVRSTTTLMIPLNAENREYHLKVAISAQVPIPGGTLDYAFTLLKRYMPCQLVKVRPDWEQTPDPALNLGGLLNAGWTRLGQSTSLSHNQSLSLELRPPQTIRRLSLVHGLRNGQNLSQGEIAGWLRLRLSDGGMVSLPVRAGIDVSEMAYVPRVRHKRLPILVSFERDALRPVTEFLYHWEYLLEEPAEVLTMEFEVAGEHQWQISEVLLSE